jgi:hypothetical protein
MKFEHDSPRSPNQLKLGSLLEDNLDNKSEHQLAKQNIFLMSKCKMDGCIQARYQRCCNLHFLELMQRVLLLGNNSEQRSAKQKIGITFDEQISARETD